MSSIIQDSTIFNDYIEYQSELIGINKEILLNILNLKVRNLLANSKFVIRISRKNLLKVLENGYFLNQFESKISDGGIYTPLLRMKIEKNVLNVPMLLNDSDRPIYGMCIPNGDNFEEYIIDGPGYFMGSNDGCVVVLNEDIIPYTTFTLGDSLANSEYLKCAPVLNPFFNGIYPDFYDKFNSVYELINASLEDIFNSDNNYLELQIHGKSNHSIDIINYIIFSKQPSNELISKINSLKIRFEIINDSNYTRKGR